MKTVNAVSPARSRAGFTLIEMMVVMVLSGVILASLMTLMMTQSKGYSKQLESMDAREATRTVSTVIGWDLRHAAAGGSTLSFASADEIDMRTITGLGVICGKHALLPRYGLWRTAGSVGATVDDSALVYQSLTSTWEKLKISAVGTPLALGVPACAWVGARVPDMVVEFVVNAPTDTSTIKVGAPLRAFQKVAYAEFQSNSRWWLGQKIGGGAWNQVAGPLLAPSANGLKFVFYDSLNAVTAIPANVASVGFTVIAQSSKVQAGTNNYKTDTVTTKVALRR
jgi:prepilin-type N-terminal cleavage/methylation domain-containing protein